jgi:molybdopterin-containing oxidoreductase family membrane subunit
MTETLLKSILFGFGVYSIFILLIKPIFSDAIKIKIEKFDNSACSIIPVIGLIYLLNWLGTLFFQYNNLEDSAEIYQLKSRLFGTNWFGYWLQPSLFLSSQLLWFKKLRKIILIRLLIALALTVSIESIVISLTSLHRDYMPSTWSVPLSSKIIEWIWSIGIFTSITIIFDLIKTRLKIKNDV